MDSPAFQQVQYAFAAHIRDPESPAPDDVAQRRMAAYSELFYNNTEGLLANTYRVLNKILSPEQWQHLTRQFLIKHQCKTPLFPQMPQEFLRYLEDEHEAQPDDPVFLYELAHYEWVELAVAIDTREADLSQVSQTGDLLAGVPYLNPTVWGLAYQYPVHQISPDFQPTEPPEQPTYLLVFRDLSDNVEFVLLNPVSARLLEKLMKNEEQKTGQALLTEIAEELQHPQPEAVVQGGLDILQSWLAQEVILGTKI
ncbi:putative DNA-binding domain-containing protein [Candidatus Albibeggiatoa sp. nov. NOAA]|uniref:HvfC family RiPP maturation protein n=1 Tax=Candidatus Albibeggiatoa sp. nov. NOAA TaxID=3162724 RepID=UPI0032FF237E|nr:putative DNA-binding domain-containing protein [Thiotrichaceae bacterium]